MPMKMLAPIALLLPSLALAVDDTTLEIIDSKAATANSKADSNHSRIQALEAEDAVLHERIDGLQPGLAGKSCPANLAVTGFDSNGELICGAPWIIPGGGEPPEISFACTINYNRAATEALLMTALGESLALLESNGIPAESGSVGAVSYEISNISVSTIAGALDIDAVLTEFTEQEPCDDAVSLTVILPDYEFTGTWNIPGLASGTFVVTTTGMVLDYSAALSAPDLSGASGGSAYDRVVESLAAIGFTGSANSGIEVTSGVLPFPTGALEFVMSTFAQEQMSLTVAQSLEPGISGIDAPVTINVISTP